MVPILTFPRRMPRWKVRLVGVLAGADLLAWIGVFIFSDPGSAMYHVMILNAAAVVLCVSGWTIWRGVRGLLRAISLRRVGVEVDAEIVDHRSGDRIAHTKRTGLSDLNTPLSSLDFISYKVELDGETRLIHDAPVLYSKRSFLLSRKPGTVHVQVTADDLSNTRPMVTPSHVAPIMRAGQVMIGLCGSAVFLLIILAEFA